MKAEIEAYIAKAYQDEQAAQLKDVYVTDRVPKQKKFATVNKKDDEQFFRYKQALEQYKNEAPAPLVAARPTRYERGSLLQRVFDPLAGATRLPNGALFYEVTDRELALPSDEKLAAEFEKLKEANSSTLEASEEEMD